MALERFGGKATWQTFLRALYANLSSSSAKDGRLTYSVLKNLKDEDVKKAYSNIAFATVFVSWPKYWAVHRTIPFPDEAWTKIADMIRRSSSSPMPLDPPAWVFYGFPEKGKRGDDFFDAVIKNLSIRLPLLIAGDEELAERMVENGVKPSNFESVFVDFLTSEKGRRRKLALKIDGFIPYQVRNLPIYGMIAKELLDGEG
jgi:hypothetical protein